MKSELPNNYPGQECFFCGEKNPIGLKLKFFVDDATGELTSDYLPSRSFAGLGNILHGGLQAGLFDEIMGWAIRLINFLGAPIFRPWRATTLSSGGWNANTVRRRLKRNTSGEGTGDEARPG